ncbi:MAG: hypothetical protein AMJ78_06930 [Omnitrophica WOR_2 bacterium SM23_29]|nr:MAG: hypothetical protein AMJ78_06930 [Omnitrophica WOR_2 bacterium SM23_29]
MSSKVKFEIADITFQFSSSYAKPILWVKEHYAIYLSQSVPDLDIHLEFKKRYKSGRTSSVPLEVISENGKFFLRSGHFDLTGSYSSGKVKVVSNHNMGVADLTRTLFSVVIVKKGGLLLHASAVADGNSSYVFCGPSESGKTTIAKLLQGKDVLTDETTAIINKDNRYYAYSTPFFGELGSVSKNRGAPVKAIFFIHKGDYFSHKRVCRVDAMRHFLYNIILSGRNLDLTNKVLDSVSNLVERVPCYDLYFKADAELWRYINGIA